MIYHQYHFVWNWQRQGDDVHQVPLRVKMTRDRARWHCTISNVPICVKLRERLGKLMIYHQYHFVWNWQRQGDDIPSVPFCVKLSETRWCHCDMWWISSSLESTVIMDTPILTPNSHHQFQHVKKSRISKLLLRCVMSFFIPRINHYYGHSWLRVDRAHLCTKIKELVS